MLTVEWMKTPRSAQELMRKCDHGRISYMAELRRLKAEGADVRVGQGFRAGNRTFWWVAQSRDTRKQKFREQHVGNLDMHDIKELV